MPDRSPGKALFYAAIAILSWSTVATAFKICLRYLSHYEMLLVASLTALLFFVLAMTIQKKWQLLRTLNRRQYLWFSFVGLLNPVAYYLVLFKAYDLLPAQVVQPINYFWPIILLVLLAVSSRQAIHPVKYIGMSLSLIGVVVISFGGKGVSGIPFSLPGLSLALLSALLWATFWLLNKYNTQVDDTLKLFLCFLFGSIYLLAGTLWITVDLSSFPGILSGIYVGLFEMGIPFIFFGLALQRTNNLTLINQLCYLSPFLSLFIIHLFLKEEILMVTYIGLILIVAGIVFNGQKTDRI